VGGRVEHYVFFQAEDGIRDFHVTGVQTCALPISCRKTISLPLLRTASRSSGNIKRRLNTVNPLCRFRVRIRRQLVGVSEVDVMQIGRASCRERVYSRWGAA